MLIIKHALNAVFTFFGIFQLQVNPKFLVLESDFTNNVVRCNIHYTGRFVTTTNCKLAQ